MFDEEIGWDDIEGAIDPDEENQGSQQDNDDNDDKGQDNNDGLNQDGDDDGLGNAQDDDDDQANQNDGDGSDNDDDDNAGNDDNAEGTDNMTGIELYLSQFNIEGGMIQFEDGSSKHFDELDSAKQSEILQQLHSSQAASVEDKYGLSDDEVGLINYARTNKKTVQEVIEELATERVQTILATREATSTDFDKMSDDAIYTKFLKEDNPEITDEDIETKLEEAKRLSNYQSIVKTLKSKFSSAQEEQRKAENKKIEEAKVKELEDQRKAVVQKVASMNDIVGVELTDNIKNSILDKVLEVDEDGDSLFMNEVFSDPEKLFKAAFMYYYGDSVIGQRDEYWKKEKSSAYKRGRSDALGKSPGSGVTFKGGSPDSSKNQRGPAPDSDSGWDDIH
jgi:hypothetical protein